MNWIIKNWPAVLLLFAGICACVSTFFLTKQDQQQKDLIEKLGYQNKELSTEIKTLSNLNNDIGTRVEKITEINNSITQSNYDLSQENKLLISEVKLLSQHSKDLITKINERTAREIAENIKTGQLLMNFKSSFKDNDIVSVTIGGMTASDPISMLKRGAKLFSFGGKDILSPTFENNKIFINLNIYDLTGNLIAEIENNYWRPNNNFSGKFNYDDHGFEVINNQGYVSINVDFGGDNKIRIQGIFPFKANNIIILAGKNKSIQLTYQITEDTFRKKLEEVDIQKLFEYTGKNWLHKRRIL